MPCRDGFDLTRLARAAADRPKMHDLFSFFPGDLRPVVGIARIGQVFVFLELLPNGADQVLGPEATAFLRNRPLDGKLLPARYDAFDQRTAREILKVEHFLFTVRVGDLDELILFRGGVHRPDREIDHLFD